MSDKSKTNIKIIKDGPYIVSGDVPLSQQSIIDDGQGNAIGWQDCKKYETNESYSLCRCGKSKNKPYCDGEHINCSFNGTETATLTTQSCKIEGPELILYDIENLCAVARFCHIGNTVWRLVKRPTYENSKEMAIKGAVECPAGRLIIEDKATGQIIEPKYDPSISVTEDPGKNVGGPLWIKGGIPIESANGEQYEVRNRVTLCRCGKSKNKPFCDGRHIASNFISEE